VIACTVAVTAYAHAQMSSSARAVRDRVSNIGAQHGGRERRVFTPLPGVTGTKRPAGSGRRGLRSTAAAANSGSRPKEGFIRKPGLAGLVAALAFALAPAGAGGAAPEHESGTDGPFADEFCGVPRSP
jgi:hypothetical protein